MNHLQNQLDICVKIEGMVKPELEKLSEKYGEEDFRYQIIGRPFGFIMLQKLMVSANLHTFQSREWYGKLGITDEQVMKQFTDRFEIFFKYMGFFSFYSSVESVFRNLIRALDSTNDGKGDFQPIFTYILKQLDLRTYEELFHFCSCLRNAVHNNGKFLPRRNNNNRKMMFNGVEYEFKYDKEIDFFYPELLFEIEEEIFACLIAIVNHDDVKSLT